MEWKHFAHLVEKNKPNWKRRSKKLDGHGQGPSIYFQARAAYAYTHANTNTLKSILAYNALLFR